MSSDPVESSTVGASSVISQSVRTSTMRRRGAAAPAASGPWITPPSTRRKRLPATEPLVPDIARRITGSKSACNRGASCRKRFARSLITFWAYSSCPLKLSARSCTSARRCCRLDTNAGCAAGTTGGRCGVATARRGDLSRSVMHPQLLFLTPTRAACKLAETNDRFPPLLRSLSISRMRTSTHRCTSFARGSPDERSFVRKEVRPRTKDRAPTDHIRGIHELVAQFFVSLLQTRSRRRKLETRRRKAISFVRVYDARMSST